MMLMGNLINFTEQIMCPSFLSVTSNLLKYDIIVKRPRFYGHFTQVSLIRDLNHLDENWWRLLRLVNETVYTEFCNKYQLGKRLWRRRKNSNGRVLPFLLDNRLHLAWSVSSMLQSQQCWGLAKQLGFFLQRWQQGQEFPSTGV